MADQPCPGACNAAYRATGEGDPRPGDPVWCRMDAARIRRLLAELDDLAALLDYQVNGLAAQNASPVGGTSAAPSPSPAADDLDELERVLLAWEDAYRDTKGWPSPPRRGTLATVTTATVAWLTAHLDGILAAGFAADFGLEVAQWHREFVGKTRAGTGKRRGKIPCPRCEYMLLASAAGTDYWVCGHCGRHLKEHEYQELCDVARELEAAS